MFLRFDCSIHWPRVATMMKRIEMVVLLFLLLMMGSDAFVSVGTTKPMKNRASMLWSASTKDQERETRKQALLGLLGKKQTTGRTQEFVDPVLADPDTKEEITIRVASPSIIVGGNGSARKSAKITMRSPTNEYQGTTKTFLNLLESVEDKSDPENNVADSSSTERFTNALNSLRPLIPPPLRMALNRGEYVPMRDLFTSPAVSFAYERGWRQGFARAGFPGPDVEFEMAQDYFEPAVAMANYSTVVDMSCATGLFTRRFAKSNRYNRVLGCDYSESMLMEARRRIVRSPALRETATRLDLVRCDVGRIPMQSNSIDALHAGAAMHCWPDLPAATQEIHRVLKPGGRYFATTFLSSYFGELSLGSTQDTAPSQMAFQYFSSIKQLRELMEKAGFDSDKIQIEILGSACVLIRCEK